MYGLLTIGVFAIYSAGLMKEEPSIQTAYQRQLLFIALGTVVFFATSLIDYRWVSWGGILVYLAGVGLSAFAVLQRGGRLRQDLAATRRDHLSAFPARHRGRYHRDLAHSGADGPVASHAAQPFPETGPRRLRLWHSLRRSPPAG